MDLVSYWLAIHVTFAANFCRSGLNVLFAALVHLIIYYCRLQNLSFNLLIKSINMADIMDKFWSAPPVARYADAELNARLMLTNTEH